MKGSPQNSIFQLCDDDQRSYGFSLNNFPQNHFEYFFQYINYNIVLVNQPCNGMCILYVSIVSSEELGAIYILQFCVCMAFQLDKWSVGEINI